MYSSRNGFKMLTEKILSLDLCSFCGACVFACVSKNLILENEKPKSLRKCKENCNLCFTVCPQVFKKHKSLQLYTNDNYEDYYMGKSPNIELLDQVASGGVITSVLLCLLEQKKVEAVIVTQFDKEIPWSPNPILTNSSLEILKASYPKYALSPTVSLIDGIIDKGYTSIAFMGLPCHIESIRIMQNSLKQSTKQFNNKTIEALKSIKYLVGLWCGNNFSKKGTEKFIITLGIDPKTVSEVGYEREENQIKFFIVSNNKKILLPFNTYLGYLLSNHIAPACRKCTRCYAYHSDLSIGGMNNPSLRWSGIITHTAVGKNILELAVESGYINIYPMSEQQMNYTKMKKIYADAAAMRTPPLR